MAAWDSDYWDYNLLTHAQGHFAAAVSDEWRSVGEIHAQAKSDAKARSLGKSGWERLYVLGIVTVDQSRKSGVFLRRGPNWRDWWSSHGDLMTGVQMVSHGTPVEEVF